MELEPVKDVTSIKALDSEATSSYRKLILNSKIQFDLKSGILKQNLFILETFYPELYLFLFENKQSFFYEIPAFFFIKDKYETPGSRNSGAALP